MKNPFGEESQRRRKGKGECVSVCTDFMHVCEGGINVYCVLGVLRCVCGESEENESTGPSFIHSPLKQYYRSITNQFGNGWK